MDLANEMPQQHVWTMADYDQMSWHDVQIHAIATDRDSFRLLFDLDYMLRWGNYSACEGWH